MLINFRHTILFLGLAIFSTGCIEEFGGVGEPTDKMAALSGTWQLESVIQVDEDAVRKGFPEYVQQMDITNLFNYTDLTLVLEVENNLPGSYMIERGNAPAIVELSSGQWELDNAQAPSAITFGENEVLEFENYLGLQEGILNLKLTRYQTNGKGEKQAFVSYRYQFVKQQ